MKPEVTKLVRNRSSRGGVKPRLIVLHTTEGHNRPGLSDLQGLAGWFDNPSAQASSHVANDAEGHDARFVPDAQKAWTCAVFNSLSLNIEQVGFASTSRDEWFKKAHKQLVNTARWIAYWHQAHGIPIQRGSVSGSMVKKAGVVTHAQLGSVGGGHHDPGGAYPIFYVIELARYLANGSEKARKAVNKVRREFKIDPLPKGK